MGDRRAFSSHQVAAARALLKWSVSGLAAKAGVSPAVVEAVEAGRAVNPEARRLIFDALYERGWICSIPETAGAGEGVRFRKPVAARRSAILNRASADMCELESRVWLRRRWGKVD